MSEVVVTINQRDYKIRCDDGQEDHLRDLAALVDSRVGELVASMGQIGDQRLLVMVTLLLADEMAEQRRELDAPQSQSWDSDREPKDNALAGSIDELAGRIETIAARLERT